MARFSQLESEVLAAVADCQRSDPRDAAPKALIFCGLLMLIWLWHRRLELGDPDILIDQDFRKQQ